MGSTVAPCICRLCVYLVSSCNRGADAQGSDSCARPLSGRPWWLPAPRRVTWPRLSARQGPRSCSSAAASPAKAYARKGWLVCDLGRRHGLQVPRACTADSRDWLSAVRPPGLGHSPRQQGRQLDSAHPVAGSGAGARQGQGDSGGGPAPPHGGARMACLLFRSFTCICILVVSSVRLLRFRTS